MPTVDVLIVVEASVTLVAGAAVGCRVVRVEVVCGEVVRVEVVCGEVVRGVVVGGGVVGGAVDWTCWVVV